MAFGMGRGRLEEHVELLQYLIYIFNTVFFSGGAAVFAIGLWIRFDEDMIDYVKGLGMYHYWNGATVIMVGAAAVMCNAFIACCGSFFRSANMILLCGGAAVFALGLWIRFDKDMDEYVEGLEMYHYWAGTTVVMVGASLVMINGFVACCGAFFRSIKMIILYKVMTVVTFILLLGGSAYVLDNGLEQSKIYPWLQEAIRDKIYQYQWDVSAKRIVDIVQEYVGCCGGYGAGDYEEIHLPIPDTCRDQVTGNQYGDSCAEVFSWYLEVRSGWISGLSLCLCFLQVFAMIFAFCMWRAIKELDDDK